MLPACRTGGEGFAIPTFDLVPSDVEGFMEELWAFQSAFHDCFARSEPRAHFFDSIPTVYPSHNPAKMLSDQELPRSAQWWRGHGQEAKRGEACRHRITRNVKRLG